MATFMPTIIGYGKEMSVPANERRGVIVRVRDT